MFDYSKIQEELEDRNEAVGLERKKKMDAKEKKEVMNMIKYMNSLSNKKADKLMKSIDKKIGV